MHIKIILIGKIFIMKDKRKEKIIRIIYTKYLVEQVFKISIGNCKNHVKKNQIYFQGITKNI